MSTAEYIVTVIFACVAGYVVISIGILTRRPKFVDVMHLRPGCRITIAGPDRVTWVITGLETAGNEAKLDLVEEREWIRRSAWRRKT